MSPKYKTHRSTCGLCVTRSTDWTCHTDRESKVQMVSMDSSRWFPPVCVFQEASWVKGNWDRYSANSDQLMGSTLPWPASILSYISPQVSQQRVSSSIVSWQCVSLPWFWKKLTRRRLHIHCLWFISCLISRNPFSVTELSNRKETSSPVFTYLWTRLTKPSTISWQMYRTQRTFCSS